MGKNRKSKRQLIRDEKRAKQRERDLANGNVVDEDVKDEDEAIEDIAEPNAKRQRRSYNEGGDSKQGGNNDAAAGADYIPLDDGENNKARNGGHLGLEREFFGMLADEEQEYFRHADELLELNDFPTAEDRDIFLQNVYKEARGKELKLASSQSCSRLMERLILLSNTRQKKHLFEAFAGHFISLVTHRFAGHCCEKLFLQSAPIVTMELSGDYTEPEPEPDTDEEDKKPQASMEDMFLLTLDELEEHLSFLLSDRYGSHALRVLLLILSGRPLDQVATKSLLQSRKKEHITVEGTLTDELSSQARAVPSSFMAATQKIIADSTANLNATALRVMAKHPTANPALQVLLELDVALAPKRKPGKKEEEQADASAENVVPGGNLLEKLVPGAPGSFSDATSAATEFVNSMLYDPIGSRLLETLITHCPGKIFKGLHQHFFGPRIGSLVRNDIASYPAIRVLSRLSKEDLVDAVDKIIPEMPKLFAGGRYNVIKTLFERCQVRNATDKIHSLLQALVAQCGGDWKHLVPKLCPLSDVEEDSDKPKDKFQQQEAKNKTALLSHGSQVVITLLGIPGTPAKAIQASLLNLSPEQLLRMATCSGATANILVKALETPSQNPNFHKVLVANLLPNTVELAKASLHKGQDVLNAIISAPSKSTAEDGSGVVAVPFHLKENCMSKLAEHEYELRETWLGRNVWRTWKGDLWNHRRHDWVRWAKETDPEDARVSSAPKPKAKGGEKTAVKSGMLGGANKVGIAGAGRLGTHKDGANSDKKRKRKSS
ncbi:armadillo-type protein [Diplogelasinospora grovesii]|uniref:Nucleolar protein 9 n=1 Tax=Diplogelasinospora grovesii TaxID=303347 RepID=A0AAN6S6V6_9PEZI|nr:armadillo-type protein [Diplogelasinospora grovesii]